MYQSFKVDILTQFLYQDNEPNATSIVGEEPELNKNDKDNGNNEDQNGADTLSDLKMCPGMDCSNTIPDDIPMQLKTVLICYATFLKEDRTNFHLATEICIMVKQKHDQHQALDVAKEKKWLAMEVDFKDIPQCIFHIYEELKQLITGQESL